MTEKFALRRIVALILLSAAFAGCNREAAAPPATGSGNKQQAKAESGDFKDYKVDVTLSTAAQAKLAQASETIIVSADYFGTPVPAAQDQADEVGQLDLGSAQRLLTGAGTAEFDGAGFRFDRLGQIQGKPQVNINVYSGRRSSPDNLLSCDMFQNALSVAAEAPIGLHCSLIAEAADSKGAEAP